MRLQRRDAFVLPVAPPTVAFALGVPIGVTAAVPVAPSAPIVAICLPHHPSPQSLTLRRHSERALTPSQLRATACTFTRPARSSPAMLDRFWHGGKMFTRMLIAGALVAAVSPACPPARPRRKRSTSRASAAASPTRPAPRLPAAQVTARHRDTNVTGSATTDADGRFRFSYLRVGPYEITVKLNGFATVTRQISLTVGAAFDLPITLPVATLEASVTVNADAVMLEMARSQIAATVSDAEIKTLPMNGRNFLDLALLVPGVSPTNVGGGTQLFPETSAVPGVSISVGSQRNLSNNFIVDGLSANDDAAALSGISYGVDAVEQFQVITSGGQAELGRALGGYVSIVTRSGTNAMRSDAYEYFRNSRFNAKNALTDKRLPMNQHQYGLSIGGPLQRDRTFFFSQRRTARARSDGPRLDRRGQRPDHQRPAPATGYQGPPVTTGEYPNPIDSVNWVAKVDQQFGGNDHFSVRYSLYDVRSSNARGVGNLNAPSASSGLDNLDQTIAAGNVIALSERTVLETRAQFAHSNLAAPPTDPIGPAVSISGHCVVRHVVGQPDRPAEQAVSSREQPVASSWRACPARRRRFRLQRPLHYLSSLGARGVPVLVARHLPGWRLRQWRLRADVRRDDASRRPIRTSACTCRTSGGCSLA